MSPERPSGRPGRSGGRVPWQQPCTGRPSSPPAAGRRSSPRRPWAMVVQGTRGLVRPLRPGSGRPPVRAGPGGRDPVGLLRLHRRLHLPEVAAESSEGSRPLLVAAAVHPDREAFLLDVHGMAGARGHVVRCAHAVDPGVPRCRPGGQRDEHPGHGHQSQPRDRAWQPGRRGTRPEPAGQPATEQDAAGGDRGAEDTDVPQGAEGDGDVTGAGTAACRDRIAQQEPASGGPYAAHP